MSSLTNPILGRDDLSLWAFTRNFNEDQAIEPLNEPPESKGSIIRGNRPQSFPPNIIYFDPTRLKRFSVSLKNAPLNINRKPFSLDDLIFSIKEHQGEELPVSVEAPSLEDPLKRFFCRKIFRRFRKASIFIRTWHEIFTSRYESPLNREIYLNKFSYPSSDKMSNLIFSSDLPKTFLKFIQKSNERKNGTHPLALILQGSEFGSKGSLRNSAKMVWISQLAEEHIISIAKLDKNLEELLERICRAAQCQIKLLVLDCHGSPDTIDNLTIKEFKPVNFKNFMRRDGQIISSSCHAARQIGKYLAKTSGLSVVGSTHPSTSSKIILYLCPEHNRWETCSFDHHVVTLTSTGSYPPCFNFFQQYLSPWQIKLLQKLARIYRERITNINDLINYQNWLSNLGKKDQSNQCLNVIGAYRDNSDNLDWFFSANDDDPNLDLFKKGIRSEMRGNSLLTREYYCKAAEKNVEASFFLARLFERLAYKKSEISKYYSKNAKYWYERAARNGHTFSYIPLGKMYEETNDYVSARWCYLRAESYPLAQEYLADLIKKNPIPFASDFYAKLTIAEYLEEEGNIFQAMQFYLASSTLARGRKNLITLLEKMPNNIHCQVLKTLSDLYAKERNFKESHRLDLKRAKLLNIIGHNTEDIQLARKYYLEASLLGNKAARLNLFLSLITKDIDIEFEKRAWETLADLYKDCLPLRAAFCQEKAQNSPLSPPDDVYQ